jgi:hypothetical protein
MARKSSIFSMRSIQGPEDLESHGASPVPVRKFTFWKGGTEGPAPSPWPGNFRRRLIDPTMAK